MNIKKLLKILSYLRRLNRLGPAGLIVAIFFLPILMLSEHKDIGAPPEPASATSVSGPRVNLDPFSQTGAFAITQRDADRATWSWTRAKGLASDIWEAQRPGTGHYSGFYCGCDIERRGSTGGNVDLGSCGYEPRANASRAARLEWEHVVPAAYIGRGRSCWSKGAPQCVDKAGQPFKGRSCCMIADPEFIMAASDPVNLVPSNGEVNADRLDYLFGIIPGEARSYGQCDMEIDRNAGIAEPPPNRRGDIGRIWAYMSRAYGLTVPRDKADLYKEWILSDPPSSEEIHINEAIARAGYRPNPFVFSAPK